MKKILFTFNRTAVIVALSASLALNGCATTKPAQEPIAQNQVAQEESVSEKAISPFSCDPKDVVCLAKLAVYHGEQKEQLRREAEEHFKNAEKARQKAKEDCSKMYDALKQKDEYCQNNSCGEEVLTKIKAYWQKYNKMCGDFLTERVK